MIIREYTPQDELGWLRCRVLSFLDSSYYNDVLTHRECYENDSVCLVAEENEKIIGLIDAEIEKEPGSLCSVGNQAGL